MFLDSWQQFQKLFAFMGSSINLVIFFRIIILKKLYYSKIVEMKKCQCVLGGCVYKLYVYYKFKYTGRIWSCKFQNRITIAQT